MNPASEDFILSDVLRGLNPLSKLFDLARDVGSIFDLFNPASENFILRKAFVPSEERINALTNTVKSKFDFIESIKLGINSIQDSINNLGNSPKLTMNLGATKYTDEQRVVVLDLSWYAPFKPYGDLIITGFVYLAYLWRLFINLGNIIHGSGGAIHADYEIVNENSLVTRNGGIIKR